MKPKIIILEGCDGVGKSSVRILISNYDGKYFILERFTPSIYAYGRLFKRNLDMNYIRDIEVALLKSFDVCPIYLYCDVNELYRRYKRGKHVVSLSKEDLMRIQVAMKDFIENYSVLKWMRIDNTNRSPQETFRIIKEAYKL